MFYLSLLFTSITQILSNSFAVSPVQELAVVCLPESAKGAWSSTGSAKEDYLLPVGIASLEHWLDLNA